MQALEQRHEEGSIVDDLVEMLSAMLDFQAFKQMMLDFKKEADAGCMLHVSDAYANHELQQ